MYSLKLTNLHMNSDIIAVVMGIILSIMGYFLSTAQSIIGKKSKIIGRGLRILHYNVAVIFFMHAHYYIKCACMHAWFVSIWRHSPQNPPRYSFHHWKPLLKFLATLMINKEQPVMLLLLPIMLCFNALKIHLLCSRTRIVVRLLWYSYTILHEQFTTCDSHLQLFIETVLLECIDEWYQSIPLCFIKWWLFY